MDKDGVIREELFFPKYADQLSRQQRAAVLQTEGPALLLAVPGGGKTTVLVTRLGYMIGCLDIPPGDILTLTYTVSAAKDMADRYRQIFGDDLPCPEFRTINGICAKIILYYGGRIGKQPFSLLTDEKKQHQVLSAIYLKFEQEYAGEAELRDVRRLITYAKNMMLGDEEIKKLGEAEGIAFDEIYREYNRFLRAQSYMDYDDQMVYALAILRSSPETLKHFQDQYRYICVDEAQDTSRIQHEIIKLLAAGSGNLFMVGDEDQSIYGFRAAYPDALLHFETDHPGARILLMEDNFRSNAGIVRAAERFVRKNRLRHEKTMRPVRPEGPEIRFVDLRGRAAQFSYLAKALSDIGEETAVLYRDNETLVPLADILERNGIPYRVRNAELSFFSNRVSADVAAIFHFAENPSDPELFLKIYYKFASYLTKQQAEKIAAERVPGIPLFEAALGDPQVPVRSKQSIRALKAALARLKTDSAEEALTRIAGPMGYREYLTRSGTADRKLRVLQILAKREKDLGSLLYRLSYLEKLLAEKESGPDTQLVLSTIHSSKGLEYDHVYLVDAADGIFPERLPDKALLGKWRRHGSGTFTDKEMKEIGAWEEERRLFYVGATRARNRLTVFRYSDNSAFADEFRSCADPGQSADAGSAGARAKRKTAQKAGSLMADAAEARRTDGLLSDYEGFRRFCDRLCEGTLVEHPVFGGGVIISSDDSFVTVRFGDGVKKLGLELIYRKGLLEIL